MKYRKDIDGLRAVAVSIVILHHVGFSFITGGYVGVDVFFVISGFLISSIVYKEALAGEFSYSNFYIRRIKRLMPALFTVLFATSIFSLALLFPSDLVKFGKSLIWIVSYVGNFFFWIAHGGYFEGNSQAAPLLHTWSLAVEEQYYFVWPLYVVIGLKIFSRRNFGILTVIVFFLAVAFSQWALQVTIGAAYYLLPTRFFELMVGSLLAIYWQNLPILNRNWNHLLSIIGIALIIWSAYTLTPQSPFPGFNALYPTLGAALLILSNNQNKGLINHILSMRPFVFIGLISYSLYLWHWPIIVFVRYTSIEMTLLMQLSIIALSVLLATLSWKFIEIPFRKKSGSNLKSVSKSLLLKPLSGIVIIASIILIGKGLEVRFSDDILVMDHALNSYSHELRPECHVGFRNYKAPPSDLCQLGSVTASSPIKGFMIGDSHSNHLTGFIDVLALDERIVVQDYTLDQCPPIFNLAWGRSLVTAEGCQSRNETSLTYIENNDFDFVILAASWPYELSPRVFENGERIQDSEERKMIIEFALRETLQTIVDEGAIPIIFDDISTVVDVDPKCPIIKQAYNDDLLCITSKDQNLFYNALMEALEADFPTIIRIDLQELMCEDNSCVLEIDGIPLYSDNDHLNDTGARYLGEIYLKNNKNPFKMVEK